MICVARFVESPRQRWLLFAPHLNLNELQPCGDFFLIPLRVHPWLVGQR